MAIELSLWLKHERRLGLKCTTYLAVRESSLPRPQLTNTRLTSGLRLSGVLGTGQVSANYKILTIEQINNTTSVPSAHDWRVEFAPCSQGPYSRLFSSHLCVTVCQKLTDVFAICDVSCSLLLRLRSAYIHLAAFGAICRWNRRCGKMVM